MKKIITLACIILLGLTGCVNGNNVDSRSTGKEKGHGYVDLGLPSGIKWASCNVGASSPEDYGNYYAWGETTPKSFYSWETYKYAIDDYDNLTKYCTEVLRGNNGFTDHKVKLDPEDDAAHVNWGGTWRMPTFDEWGELYQECTWIWTMQNGVKGYIVTSKKNGNSIFLPAAGCRRGETLYSVGEYGGSWSSSLLEGYPSDAWGLCFLSGDQGRGSDGRYYGFAVRPVCQ